MVTGLTLPLLLVLAILGVLAGVAKKVFGSVLVILAAQLALFAFFPRLLLAYVDLISTVRAAVIR